MPTPAVTIPLGDRAEQRVPMSRLRARIAERLLQSQQTNAILTTFGLLGAAESIERERPYNAWREILGSYFDLDDDNRDDPPRERVTTRLAHIAPHLAERAPLLNDILGLDLLGMRMTTRRISRAVGRPPQPVAIPCRPSWRP